MRKRLIIDCDTGVDDAQAILLALLTNDVEILAITCVHGNLTAEQAARNTVRVLYAADDNCSNIPVFVGCEKSLLDIPLLRTIYTGVNKFHGNDGLGDAPQATFGEPPYASVIQHEKAASAICRIVNENPGEISMVCLGPLTNLGLAFRLDETIIPKIKEIYIMGGAIYAKGNATVVGEFNTATDPEAASIVLESAVCPTHLVSWEVSMQGGIDWEWYANWVNQENKVMRFIKQISAHTVQLDQATWNASFSPPDLVTMAWVLDDRLCTKSKLCYCYVDSGGNPLTRGQLIVDWKGLLGKSPNITVCEEWCPLIFKEVLTEMLR